MKCTVLGSGTWGTALGQVLADNGNNVTIYGIYIINFIIINTIYSNIITIKIGRASCRERV